MKNKILSLCSFATIAAGLVFTALTMSCSNDDSDIDPIPAPVPKQQWSKTLKGNGEELGAYPDLYVNYWEYTYNLKDHKDKVIIFKGEFPHCRYFSFSLYDDNTGDVIGGIDDRNITPDAGCENPFHKTVTGEHTFTVCVVPSTIDEQTISRLGLRNVCRVDADVERVAVVVREYLGTNAAGTAADEYGGVDLPAITAINVYTGAQTAIPEHVATNVNTITSKVFSQKSDENNTMPFFLAPVSRYYPNNSTAYLYARTHLRTDSVLVFRFIPAPYPTKPEEYATSVTRYWSICLGSCADTRSYYSICDKDANFVSGEKATFVVCLKNNPRLSEIRAKVEEMNGRGEHVNLFVWDSEKLNVDGKPIGEVFAVMYRNILPDRTWPYSIANMLPTAYKDADGEPIDHVTQPDKQLAHLALGNYGPLGVKYSTTDFLEGKTE
ncbi:MAG: hypothetical protein MR624_06485 [Bacteroidales bacterium]|nr:hypothetical protein [Bacteroidales bacterium]MCI6252657.1 hypothetical protein [Bacteroidales bacterium]MDY6033387.1 hypothetical protein [Alloprevotella sp.]